jgi:ADP-heptose:LPS heptosyltransferase
MDLIISIDTSVAHLAAALGKQLWLLLPDPLMHFMAVIGREDCSWYPTVRLFKQPQPGDWETVVSQVIQELDRFAV